MHEIYLLTGGGIDRRYFQTEVELDKGGYVYFSVISTTVEFEYYQSFIEGKLVKPL